MLLNKKKVKMLLHKGIAVIAIALFSVMAISVNAQSVNTSMQKNYSQFNWEEFAKQSKDFWSQQCHEDEECRNDYLNAQKKFYQKLYRILSKYQKKNIYLNDQLIIGTVFFDLMPSDFTDDGSSYNEHFGAGKPYYIDDSVGEENDTEDISGKYFDKETDTLKLLTRSMLGYDVTCYGIYGAPTVITLEDGTSAKICQYETDENLIIQTIDNSETCVSKIISQEMNYAEFSAYKFSNAWFLGVFYDDDFTKICKSEGEAYPGGSYSTKASSVTPKESVDNYLEFLSDNRYFDGKAHLQSYFQEVFDQINNDKNLTGDLKVECMVNDICSNSVESISGAYDTYYSVIQTCRNYIIKEFVSILENYGYEIDYFYEDYSELTSAYSNETTRNSYFWPIGSDTTEVRNNITFADKEPASVNVISYYGARNDGTFNYGVDIAGTDGVTNVISIFNGEVLSVTNSCTTDDLQCNEGYGNEIVISNNNGDYVVYSGLASIDSSIKVGTSVKSGQLLGKVGSTGSNTNSALHLEIRSAGNAVTNAVDPLKFINASNSRPAGASGDFDAHRTSLTREEFVSKLRSYCNTHTCKKTMNEVFVRNAGEVYDSSIKYNINPEFVIVRGIAEGFSPGCSTPSTNNYWGIGCGNGEACAKATRYTSLDDGIRGLANLRIIKEASTASDIMSKYAYIGDYWFNPGGSDVGGCYYFPHIKEFMDSSLVQVGERACSSTAPSCSKSNTSGCTRTTAGDQKAYATWQVQKNMAPTRFNIFGL